MRQKLLQRMLNKATSLCIIQQSESWLPMGSELDMRQMGFAGQQVKRWEGMHSKVEGLHTKGTMVVQCSIVLQESLTHGRTGRSSLAERCFFQCPDNLQKLSVCPCRSRDNDSLRSVDRFG